MTDTALPRPGSLKAWLLASRPKTLAAAAIPVLVGTAVALAHGAFAWLPALVAFLCAALIQIGTNFANDYFDHQSGADNEDRLGPTRVTQAGLIEPNSVKWATGITFLIAFVLGLYLVWVGGWPILAVGIASIISGVAYTGGPYPLGYNGLGDLFVFIFFGLVAVGGTYYVQALQLAPEALVAAIPVGLLSTAIIVVNNYRDLDTDRDAGKKTLAVRIGPSTTRIQYAVLLLASYAVPIAQWLIGDHGWTILLPLLTLPLAALRIADMYRLQGSPLNALLANTAKLLTLFGFLYAIGFIL